MSEVIDLARTLQPQDDPLLRQGVVAAVSGLNTSVKWGNSATASPNQRSVSSYIPRVGDVVFGVKDNSDMLILGPVDKGSTPRRIAWQISPAVYTTLGLTTSPQDVQHMGIECGAVPAGHIVKVEAKLWALSPTQEGYLFVNFSEGVGGSRTVVDESRMANPGSLNSPSQMVQATARTVTDYANLYVQITASVSTGTATLFVSHTNGSAKSHILVTDLGYAANALYDIG